MADFEDFKRAEKSGWDAQGPTYHLGAEMVTPTAAPVLLDMADVRAGDRVMIIACGPGFGMDIAAARGAEVLGMDFSEAMLKVAREKYPGQRFEQGDAENLIYGDETFDTIICPFGVLHFAYPQRAFEEFFRVLRANGRLAFSIWAGADQNPFFAMALDSIAKHGTLGVAMPAGPDMFRYTEAAICRQDLGAAGFNEIAFQNLPIEARSDDLDFLVNMLKYSTVRTKVNLDAQTPEVRQAVFKDLRQQSEGLKTANGDYMLPFNALCIAARKPKRTP